MARRPETVDVRSTGPQPADDIDEARMLYREVRQVPDPKQFKVEWPLLTAAKMAAMLKKADADEQFRQRPTAVRDISRWKKLIESKRFVHYLPNGPLCYDPDGALLNGKHRLTAGVACGESLGFMVVRGVPRWMFRYFDTPKVQSLNDILVREGHAANRPQVSATLRLALRYEELLHGLREGTGWRHWSGIRDEHTDLEDLLLRREPLMDQYSTAVRTHRGVGPLGCRLVITSLMVFRFYQELAWPAGADQVEKFFEALKTGAMVPVGSPAKTLREWGYDSYENKESWPAKRESHLLLLLRHFDASVRGAKIHRVDWGYGHPMPAPYHPDGVDVAVKNVLTALQELDRDSRVLLAGD